jgi:hypothetical protein
MWAYTHRWGNPRMAHCVLLLSSLGRGPEASPVLNPGAMRRSESVGMERLLLPRTLAHVNAPLRSPLASPTPKNKRPA